MKKKVSKFFLFVSLLLGIVILLMMLLPVLKYTNGDTTYTGIQVITGLSIADAGFLGTAKMPFNVLALIAFIIPVLGAIISVLFKKGYIISAVMFTVSGVLFFVLPEYTYVEVTVLGSVTTPVIEWTLQSGAIIAGVCSILGVFVSLLGFAKKD